MLLTFLLPILPIYVPAFNEIFRTEQPDVYELSRCLGASAIVFIGVEIEKFIGNNRKKSNCLHTNFGKNIFKSKGARLAGRGSPYRSLVFKQKKLFLTSFRVITKLLTYLC